MHAFANHFAFEFKTGIRSSSLMFMNYVFPLAFYAMMGVVMTAINPIFVQSMLPAITIFTMMSSTILSLPSPLVESREAGIFRSFKVNGVPALSILTIPLITTVIHALIAAALIAATAGPLFGAVPPANWPVYWALTVLTALTCGSLGALIGVVSSDSRASVLWSQLVFLPSMLIGGLMMPLSVLPAAIRPLSFLLPTSHAMQAYTGLAYGQPTLIDPLIAVGVLSVSAVLAFGLAIYLFNWDSKNQARRGHPALALLVLAPYVVSLLMR